MCCIARGVVVLWCLASKLDRRQGRKRESCTLRTSSECIGVRDCLGVWRMRAPDSSWLCGARECSQICTIVKPLSASNVFPTDIVLILFDPLRNGLAPEEASGLCCRQIVSSPCPIASGMVDDVGRTSKLLRTKSKCSEQICSGAAS